MVGKRAAPTPWLQAWADSGRKPQVNG